MKTDGKDRVFVFGASGHGKVVIDVIERQGLHVVEFLVDDDPALKGRDFFTCRVIGGRMELLEVGDARGGGIGIVAIGSNAARRVVASWLTENGFGLITAIHPSAQVTHRSVVGVGTVLMAGTAVNADTVIGDNVIVNTGATIDHDCVIGDCVHVAPGATLCGTVRVGEGTFIGAGSTVIPNISIGRDVVIGAGSTVVRDVPDRVLIIGTPAKVVRNLEV